MLPAMGTLTDHKILETLHSAIPDLLAVYRFGSSGTMHERAESDIDIAFWAKEPASNSRRWELAQDLAALLSKDLDLVDLGQASTVLRLQVVAHGERIFCSDEARVERFEDLVFSAYARLNEERRGILEDIRQRGSVYGG